MELGHNCALDKNPDCVPSEEILDSINMEERPAEFAQRRRRILVILLLNLQLQVIVANVLVQQQAALVTVTNGICVMHLLFSKHRRVRLEPHARWRLDRSSPWMDSALLSTYTEREFRRRCRVSRSTFFYICSLLAPELQRGNKGGGIRLENIVGLSLNRLGTGNYLLSCADQFGMHESTACIVVRHCCVAILKVIRPLVVPKNTESARKRLAAEFEAKHGIPFIMGAIDGSHIPIIAPSPDPAPFYNRKGFHSVLLQGIVDMQTLFWDWDFGWAGSLHDYTMFSTSWEGIQHIAGNYLPYKLIGDAAYPCRMSMYVPFKGQKENLDPIRANWNFIHSSTRMCVERAFGVLKGRWRILLRRNEMKLEHIADVVGACICLHNLCIMLKDLPDSHLEHEANTWLRKHHWQTFSDVREAGMMKIVEYGKAELARVEIDVEELIRQAALPNDHNDEIIDAADVSSASGLQAGTTMHWQLAKTLYDVKMRELGPLEDGYMEEESDSSVED